MVLWREPEAKKQRFYGGNSNLGLGANTSSIRKFPILEEATRFSILRDENAQS
jgi:hypothetical protein